MSRRLLLVDIIEAKNLIACERSGTSDPFISANLVDIAARDIKNEKFKTESKARTLAPKWDTRFTFGQNYDLNNTTALPTLSVKVFHKASTFGTDAPMGVVDIPLDSIDPMGNATNQWYPLAKTGRMKDVAGELHLNIRFSQPPPGMSAPAAASAGGIVNEEKVDIAIKLEDDDNPDHEDAEPNELQVVCVQARDLLIMDKNLFGSGGSSDPLCILKVQGFPKQETKHLNKTLNPVWNEKFSIAGVRDTSLSLEVTVEDHDLTVNDFMGKIVIPLQPFADKKEQRKWYKLKNQQGATDEVARGEVELIIKWVFNPACVQPKKQKSLLGKFVSEGSDTDVENEEEGQEPEEAPLSPEEAEKAAKEKAEAEAKLKEELGEIEVKSGDYQIQVNIIEARELKGKDLSGLSDPIVYIEAFGQTQNSSVKPASLNCVFDELFIFNMRNLDKDEFKEGVVRVRVMNANVVAKNDLIGAYQFDAANVYYQKDHELYRKWVALMNEEDPQDTGVQGYLQLSVQIVGPGDKLKVHDVEAEMKEEREKMAKSGNDLGSMIMMPPTVKKEWKFLVTTIYKCQYLPLMDLAAIGSSGTDAFVSVSFAGGKPTKTKVRTLKGQRSAINPEFNYEIWTPVSTPTASQTCKISVWDYDLSGNEMIASCYTKYNLIEKLHMRKTGPYWVNLYGAPEAAAFTIKGAVTGAVSALKTLGGMDYKDVYNNFPDKGSTYKGRMLMAQRIEDKRPPKYESEEMEPFRKSIKKLKANQEPPVQTYKMKALVVTGTEMPALIDKSNPLKKQKLQIRVSCGSYEMVTNRVDCNNGVTEFNELLNSDEMVLPVVMAQVPDILVHVCKGKDKDIQAICFARFKAADVMKENFEGTAKWIYFQEDKVIDALDDGEFPGTLLIKLGFGTAQAADDRESEWKQHLARTKMRTPYQLRLHVYQGQDLPAADDNGLLDPYLKINFLGQKQKSDQKKKTRYPLYYQTLIFNCELPDREFFPQCNIQLFDHDDLSSDDYMGQIFYNLQDAFVLTKLTDPFPDPVWMEFFNEVPGDGQGKILISGQLIPKTTPDMQIPPPPSITPALKPAWIEVIALGMRNMKPYQFQDMVFPFLEMELECIDKKVKIETESSKKPHPSSPNFLQRLIMPVQLPENALFATPMALKARDVRLGGFNKPEVGVGVVDLVDKIPWSKTYKPPQTDIFFQNSLNKAEGFGTGGEQVMSADGVPKEAVLDGSAKAALELVEKRKDNAKDELLATQEPLSVDEYVKRRINPDDTGAGVFGALLHIEAPQYGGKHKKTAEDFFGEVNWDESDEVEPPKYMKNRKKLPAEMEGELQTTPFESYNLTRGQKNGTFGSNFQIVGKFKGLVRVMLSEKEAPLFDLDTLLKPQGYKIRLYVLAATNLTPMDMGFGGRPGKSDPYIRVTLGKDVLDDRENAIDDVTDVDLYKVIEFNGELPGWSQLTIEMMDKDDIGSDDLIGKTIIDLEDRWFDRRWQDMGKEERVVPSDDPNNTRWDVKSIERRSLYVPSSNNAQGILECWLDILTPAEAGAFPPDDVALPPRQMFELRIVIWKTKDVPAQDTLGGQNMTDLFIKCWPEGCDEQETDTHWRAKKGKGSFNWRLKFDVELGHNTRAMKFPQLHFQLWDRDLLKWNDCFADGIVDIGKYYRKAFKKGIAIKAFPTLKGASAKKAEDAKKRREMYGDDPIPDIEEDKVPPEDPPAGVSSPTSTAGVTSPGVAEHKADSDDEEDDAGIGVMGKMKKEEKQSLLDAKKEADKKAAEDKQKKVEEAKRKADAKKKAAAEAGGGDEPKESDSLLQKEENKDEEDAELTGFVNNIKEMTGLWDMTPEDSTWLHMDHLDHETQVREPMGKICWGMQIWPKDKALVMVNGAGRNEPNTDPFLPPPTGRLQFTWNPFMMGMQLCGPSLCLKFMCCILCLGILALMIFCQPALNILIALFLY